MDFDKDGGVSYQLAIIWLARKWGYRFTSIKQRVVVEQQQFVWNILLQYKHNI